MINYKVHETQGKKVLAACDSKLNNKKLEDKKRKIKVRISPSFYGEQKISEKDFLKVLEEEFDSINLLGEKTVSAAIKKGLTNEKQVVLLAGQKHAIIVII